MFGNNVLAENIKGDKTKIGIILVLQRCTKGT